MINKLNEVFRLCIGAAKNELHIYEKLFDTARTQKDKYENDIKQNVCYAMIKEDQLLYEELEEAMNQLIYLIIYKTWNEKRQKWSFYYKTKLYVSGEENLGPQDKTITVVFGPLIDKDILGTGVYVLDSEIVKLPKKYTIQICENGEKKYPYLYIQKIEKFIPEGIININDTK